MRRDLLLLTIGAAAVLATASAHVRVTGARTSVVIDVAARGISATVQPATLDCGRAVALAGCPKASAPRQT